MRFFYEHLIIRKIIPQITHRIILLLIFMAILVTLFSVLGREIKRKDCTRHGIIFFDEIWSGTIELTGDITILPFSKLTIEPGTKIIIQANRDDCGGGRSDIIDEMTKLDPTSNKVYARTHTSITTYGTLNAQGKDSFEQKIIFTSSAETPKETDWNGILFYGRFAKGILENCIVEWAHYGPAVHNTDRVIIRKNIVRHCFWGGIHTFRSNLVLEDNEIYLCGHEAFDTHEASPVIRNNIIGHCLVGAVINNTHETSPVIFENNIVYYCANIMCIQDNGRVIIRNNKFISSEAMPMQFSYGDFTLPHDTIPMGIELCDNVQAEIYDNYFSGCEQYTITYSPVGPNNKIRHTTHRTEHFETNGIPQKILIKNNIFEKTAPVTIRKKGKNVEIKDNIWK